MNKTPTPLDMARIQAALMHTQALVARMNFIVAGAREESARGGWRADWKERFDEVEREWRLAKERLAGLLEPQEGDMVADWMAARLNSESVTTGGMQP